jgi:TPR repeat protein
MLRKKIIRSGDAKYPPQQFFGICGYQCTPVAGQSLAALFPLADLPAIWEFFGFCGYANGRSSGSVRYLGGGAFAGWDRGDRLVDLSPPGRFLAIGFSTLYHAQRFRELDVGFAECPADWDNLQHVCRSLQAGFLAKSLPQQDADALKFGSEDVKPTTMKPSRFNRMLWVLLWIFQGAIFMAPLQAQTTYPVPEQSASYPLKTQLSPATIAEYKQVFKFGSFSPEKAIALRARLLPLAEANDPVACFLLAKTYDWYEFGVGQDRDRSTALKWYRQAASLNYADAAYFLYYVYSYRMMGVPKNKSEAVTWLLKANELAAGKQKAAILLELARLSDPSGKPEVDPSVLKRGMAIHLQYLKQAFAIDPQDVSVADYYGGSLYDAGRYSEALPILKNSSNPMTWKKIGQMYERGQGIAPDIAQALVWYKKMAIEGKDHESDLNPITRYGKYEIYRLLCLKKITAEQAAPIYTPEDYEQVYQRTYGQNRDLNQC